MVPTADYPLPAAGVQSLFEALQAQSVRQRHWQGFGSVSWASAAACWRWGAAPFADRRAAAWREASRTGPIHERTRGRWMGKRAPRRFWRTGSGGGSWEERWKRKRRRRGPSLQRGRGQETAVRSSQGKPRTCRRGERRKREEVLRNVIKLGHEEEEIRLLAE